MIGDTIKTLRLQAKMSQEELAKLMHINRVSLSQIEAGERKVTTDELILLSNIFEVDANILL
jgi:transcriptional regulator with XRE-family HTH domain